MRSKPKEPGNQETKTTTKTKTNSNARSACLFQMFPLLLLLNATNPASTRQIDSFLQQDKVNYAVSEREDRVTGATTLTRMAGCNGMYWAATVLC